MTIQSVLVLGDFPQTLAVVRSLGRAGYRVVVAHTQKRPVSTHSRYCADTWRCPDFTNAKFKSTLHEYLQKHREVMALYPIGIDAIGAVRALKTEQNVTQPVIGVSTATLTLFDDKDRANAVVRQAGVEVPKSIQVKDVNALREAATNLNFPIIIKSGSNAGPLLGRKAYVVNDFAQLDVGFTTWPQGHDRLMLQRYVNGKMVACDFIARDGEIVAYYEGAHYRTDAADGTGYVVDFRAAKPTPKLFTALKKIVSHTQYSGPGLLQCVICSDTGSCFFIELNPRLSAGVAAVVNAGLDMPLIALQSSLGSNLPPVQEQTEPRYRVNAHTYWLERDVMGWFNQRRELKWSGFLHWVRLMCTSFFISEAHINWSWRDPAPSMRILIRYLGRALSPAKSRLRPTAWLVLAHLKAVRSGHSLPPGGLTDLYKKEFRNRRYVLERASKSGNIFKAMQRKRIIICLVGLKACRRILSEQGERLRANSVDLTSLFPKGILRKLEGEDHQHYRQALVTALDSSARSEAPETNSQIINHWLHQHATRFPNRASTAKKLTTTLDNISTALLIHRYFGVTLGTDDFDELMTLFHQLGPDSFVWDVGAPQKQTFEKIRIFLLKRLPDSAAETVLSEPSVIQRSFDAQNLDDVLLGNLIYMVEMGRYDLHSLFRWLLKYAAENFEILQRIAAEDCEIRNDTTSLATAFVQETLRMDQCERLIRIVKEDFVFDGYFFPKNAIVRLCLWESHKLEKSFPHPFTFNPQRFLDMDYGLDMFAPFGLNQHHCPMAEPVIQMGASFIKTLADGYGVVPILETAANRGPYHWPPGKNFSVMLCTQQKDS